MAGARPNVILVITDDQGYGDLSCHGNPLLKTPELDKLYDESVRLTDFHVAPTCAPTRGALMSGQWTNRAGPWHTIMGRSMLFEDKTTLGQVFADNGYATGMFGKWHLGDNYPYRPEDRGFQDVVRHGAGGVGQTPDYWNNAYFDDTYFHNSKPQKYEGFCTDVFFSEAKRFIKSQADQGKPFFAYISSNAPHSPFHCPEKYVEPYRGHEGIDEKMAIFFGMIANIDENVGMLRNWLAEKGLAENTIFIFMTDNGSATGWSFYNAGMRGKKGRAYEGGHRVPFFLHWPAGGFDQGRDIETLTAHVDVLPTLMKLCQLNPLPDDYLLDGRSIVPLLRNPQVEWPERVVITDSQRVVDPIKWKQSSTMTERWRMINGEELYDIYADPGQQKDVSAEYPEVMAELRSAYDAWWEDISPAFKKTSRMHVGNPAENPAVLTCHDWITGGKTPPWNQSHIRRTRPVDSYKWAITVEQAGTYRIALRRWPRESGLSLRSGAAPGDPVPGLEAYRDPEGVSLPITGARIEIAGKAQAMDIPQELSEAVFELHLPAGDTDLNATFKLDSGEEVGAYYAYVEKL
jgi:arylsulfatase B